MLLLIILSSHFPLPWILQHFTCNTKASVTYVYFLAFIENTVTFNIWQPSSTLTHHSIAHAHEYFHILHTKANVMYICLPLQRTWTSWEKLMWDVLLHSQWALYTNSIIQTSLFWWSDQDKIQIICTSAIWWGSVVRKIWYFINFHY